MQVGGIYKGKANIDVEILCKKLMLYGFDYRGSEVSSQEGHKNFLWNSYLFK